MTVGNDNPSRTTQTRRRHAAGRRARILKEGGRRVDLLLEYDVSAELAALEQADGEDATAVIARLIKAEAAARRGDG